jgi:hypothetical protein
MVPCRKAVTTAGMEENLSWMAAFRSGQEGLTLPSLLRAHTLLPRTEFVSIVSFVNRAWSQHSDLQNGQKWPKMAKNGQKYP